GIGRGRLLGDNEGDQRQPHADEDAFAILDLPGRGRDHEFVEGVGAHCTALIAFFLTSPIVSSGSRALRGAIHFFSLPMMSRSNFLSAAVGIHVSNCSRYSFSSIGWPVLGWKSCPFQRLMLRLNLISGQ